MSVDSLLAQHVRILLALEALERLAAQPAPPAVATLARARWTLARDILLHLGEVEAQVYRRMPNDARAAAALADARVLLEALRVHMERWHAVSPLAWTEHREAVKQFAASIRTRLDTEARQIVTLLPALPWPDRAAAVRDEYAAEAWHMRGLIFGLSQLPRA